MFFLKKLLILYFVLGLFKYFYLIVFQMSNSFFIVLKTLKCKN